MAAHLRLRYERLEWATKFRPIHIGVLLLSDAPPPRREDYFYRAGKSERSGHQRIFFEELLGAAGIPTAEAAVEESALAEFQHRGFFLAEACECPLEELAAAAGEDPHHFLRAPYLRKFAPTVVKRIQFSYKPKKIVPIGNDSGELVLALRDAGLGERLVLENGRPIFDPSLGDPAGSAEFRTALGERIERALSALP
jgi:hypothetical protein